MLLLFLFRLLLLSPMTAATDEKSIILNLKNSFQIPSASSTDFFLSWSTSSSSPSNFSGITCSSLNSVSSINLSNLSLSGIIPFSLLCSLPFLSSLSLASNHFSGTISTALRNCSGIRRLDLAQNLLSGPSPWSSLANLTAIESLSLGDNFFDPSPFPIVVTTLTKLNWLYISVCNLHGEVPPAIGNLT